MSARVVEALDVVEHVGLCIGSGTIDLARCSLRLQRREEAFHGRIFPDIAGAAHRADDTVVLHERPEPPAGILATPVGMMQQSIGLAPPPHRPDRHEQCVGDQLSVIVALMDQPTARRENRSITAAT